MDNRFFDLGSLITEASEKTGDKIKCGQFLNMHSQKLVSLKDLIKRLPNENEIFFIETIKSFNAFTFIIYLIKEAGIINDLFIATYSINIRILNSLAKWIDKGDINQVHIYISDSIKQRMPKVVETMEGISTTRDIKITYSWTHKKVICARINNDYYVIEGSGNFSENSAEEQYIFTKSKNLYEFRRGNN